MLTIELWWLDHFTLSTYWGTRLQFIQKTAWELSIYSTVWNWISGSTSRHTTNWANLACNISSLSFTVFENCKPIMIFYFSCKIIKNDWLATSGVHLNASSFGMFNNNFGIFNNNFGIFNNNFGSINGTFMRLNAKSKSYVPSHFLQLHLDSESSLRHLLQFDRNFWWNFQVWWAWPMLGSTNWRMWPTKIKSTITSAVRGSGMV